MEGHGGAWRDIEGHGGMWGWVNIERADLVVARCRLAIAIAAIAVIVIVAVPALA